MKWLAGAVLVIILAIWLSAAPAFDPRSQAEADAIAMRAQAQARADALRLQAQAESDARANERWDALQTVTTNALADFVMVFVTVGKVAAFCGVVAFGAGLAYMVIAFRQWIMLRAAILPVDRNGRGPVLGRISAGKFAILDGGTGLILSEIEADVRKPADVELLRALVAMYAVRNQQIQKAEPMEIITNAMVKHGKQSSY